MVAVPSISILIPSCNRPAKLLRQVIYLYRLVKIGDFSDRRKLDSIEILIAENTSSYSVVTFELRSIFISIVDYLKNYINITYFDCNHSSLSQRLSFLSANANSDYSMFLGDDDLPIVSSILDILQLARNGGCSSVVGRYANLIYNTPFDFRFSFAERPYSNFILDDKSLLVRFSQFQILNSLGTSSTFYALQETNILKDFCEIILKNEENLYYAGYEGIHQAHTISSGKTLFSGIPYLVRDFNYSNYIREDLREAPESDEVPYAGKRSLQISSEIITNSASKSISQAECLNYLLNFRKLTSMLQVDREIVRPFIETVEYTQYFLEMIAPNELNSIMYSYSKTFRFLSLESL